MASFYVVYSPSRTPVHLTLMSHSFQVPQPFPSMIAVFALSSKQDVDLTRTFLLVNQEDPTDCLEIGRLCQKERAFCWQPCHNENFRVPEGQHSFHLYVATDSELRTILAELQQQNKSDVQSGMADEDMVQESSQTESQGMTSNSALPEAERILTSCSPEVKKKGNKGFSNEVTPQLQVQGTPDRPPGLTHSASKKRKASSQTDAGTPPSTRKKAPQPPPPPPSPSLSSPLSSKTANTRKKMQESQRVSTPRRKQSTSGPSARWGHTLCDVGNHRSLLIGGQGHKQAISKDSIWMLDTDKNLWSTPPIVACSDKFPSRMGHTATFDPQIKSVFVFGGSKNLRWFSDMHVLDLDTWKWSHIEACGVAPTRAYHSCTLFRSELYIFGGVYPNPDPQPDGCSNDVFIFNPESESWYQPVTMGTKPKPRSGHSATLLGDKLVIFGGWDAPVCYNDLHILDLCLMEFTSPPVNGKPPSPRSWHASIALSDNRVLIHGGYNGNEALADAFIFNLDTHTWSQVELNSSDMPIGIRAGHTLTHFNGNQKRGSDGKENEPCESTLAVFGGGDNEDNFFSDLVPFTLT